MPINSPPSADSNDRLPRQPALRRPPAAGAAVGDGPRGSFPVVKGAASRGWIWVHGNLRIPGVSNRNGSVRCDQDPRVQRQVRYKEKQEKRCMQPHICGLVR